MTDTITTECAISGGGPAGVMLGYLLARAGVNVVVLEKHEDFFRDFRGDTIHPSTLQVLHELGILDDFLKRTHQEVRQLGAQIGDDVVQIADFSHLPAHCAFLAFMPQWHFLDFLAEQGRKFPCFDLRMKSEVDELIKEDGRVVGLRAATQDGDLEVRADLVVGTDGRHSVVRALAGLEVEDLGAPMDVLWLRLSKSPKDGSETLGRINRGHFFIMIDRGDYWQCAFVIPKGGFNELRRKGLEAFRLTIVSLKPSLEDRVREISSWDDVALLTVRVDRLKRWYHPGLLCIGDAAHAMSPIGGVGINLAIQDALAAANILAGPLLEGRVREEDLRKVQKRRMLPTQLTQALQVFIQDRVISTVLQMTAQPKMPFAVKLLNRFPVLRRIPARVIGMGFRPEHVETSEARAVPAEKPQMAA
jgi:2-polyprenyl-6-methoxyphenol hydroxylase-like FAD-dependent oxidoreductase